MQGPEKAAARAQLTFAIESVNNGIAGAIAQLSATVPSVKFLLLDWNKLTQEISEYHSGEYECEQMRLHRANAC